METTRKMRIHPLAAGAAVAVIITSAVAVAAMTGHLPGSNAAPRAPQSFAAAPAPAPASPMVAVPPPAPVPPVVAIPQPTPNPVVAAAPGPVVAQAAPKPVCHTCGVVSSVNAYKEKPERSVVGMVGGGVVGALVGHELGHGSANTLATVGGAAGGAYLGNKIGQKVQTKTHYKVVVRMNDGHTRSFTYAEQPGFHAGSHVRIENGTLVHG